METTSLNMTLFIATALIAVGLAVWQFQRAKKAKGKGETSAMGEPVRHEGHYDGDGTDKYKPSAEPKYQPAPKDKFKTAP